MLQSASRCAGSAVRILLDLHLSAKLLDPLKLEITRQDHTKVNCVAVIKESEDEGFILKNVYHDLRAKGTPQFDIVLPEK